MRPVPELEVPASDDEIVEPTLPTAGKSTSMTFVRHQSPELGNEFQDEEEPSDLEEVRDKDSVETQEKKPKKAKTTRKAKGGYTIGKQVSGNFVSYKIRSKGHRGSRGFGGGRFRRR